MAKARKVKARKPKKKATGFVQFKLRIRESLRRQIVEEARKKSNSANKEAVTALERTFDDDNDWVDVGELAHRVSSLEDRIRGYETSQQMLGRALNQWHYYATTEGRNLLNENTAEGNLFRHIAVSCKIPVGVFSGFTEVEMKPMGGPS